MGSDRGLSLSSDFRQVHLVDDLTLLPVDPQLLDSLLIQVDQRVRLYV